LLLAGCGAGAGPSAGGGEESRTAAQIVDDARAAISQAHSFKITAKTTSKDGPSTLVLKSDGKGNATGSGTLSSATVQMIVKDGKVYIKGKEFFASLAQAAGPATVNKVLAAIGEKWVLFPGNSFGDLASRLDSSSLADCLQDHGTLTRGGTQDVNGVRAVVVHDKGDTPGDSPGDIYVAVDSPHYAVRFTSSGAKTPGKPVAHGKCPAGADSTNSAASDSMVVDLSEFNAPVTVTAPTDVFDLSTFTP
jgi:hypothetical protein